MLAFITVSMAVREEKLGGGPMDWSAGVLRIVSGALFLGSSRVHPTLLGQRERMPRTETVCSKHTCGIHRSA
jgi:hypothetical protein